MSISPLCRRVDPDGVACTQCLNVVDMSGWPSHSTRAVGGVEATGNDFGAVVQLHTLRLVKHKLQFWASRIPARIKVAGTLAAEEGLRVFGLSAEAGGPPEYERSIRRALSAFHAQKVLLTSQSLSVGTRWEGWFRHLSTVLTFGSWGWLCDAATKSRIETTVNRMVRYMLGHGKPEGEGRLMWHTRTLRNVCRADAWPARQHLGALVVPARADFHPKDDGWAECPALHTGGGNGDCVPHVLIELASS